MSDSARLPQPRADQLSTRPPHFVNAEYIAGMTRRYQELIGSLQ